MPENKGTLLLVDDDPEFAKYCIKIAEDEGLNLKNVGSVAEAKKAIESDEFSGFLVDHSLPDGEGVDFIRYLRKNEKYKEVPVALVTAHRLESPLFQKMREELNIKYAVEKPLEVEELKQLYSNLLTIPSVKEKPPEAPESDDFLDDLKNEYRASIPEKIAKIESLIKAIETGFSNETVTTLKKELHKIAGSAGSYGFEEVSRFCKKKEVSLEEDLKDIERYRDKEEWLNSLWFFFNNMKLAFETSESENTLEKELSHKPVAVSGVHLYVIDDDQDLVRLIKESGKASGLIVEGAFSIDEGLEKLKDHAFQPRIILVDKNFNNDLRTGYDLIEAIREEQGDAFSSVLGMFTGEGTVEQRVHATSLGVELFFQKPIEMDKLFSSLEEVLASLVTNDIRVMHIDDDEEFANFVKSALSEMNIKLTCFFDGIDFFKKLEDNPTDLLLLDIEMPKFTGLTLLESLRADFRFRTLPVILLTSREDEETIQKGFTLGIEDYVQKPVTKEMLQVRMRNFMRKRQSITTPGERDELTGLFSQTAITDIFHTISAQERSLCLTGIEITHPKEVPKLALTEFAKFLSTHFRSKDIMGRWEGNRFVILFPGFKATQMSFLLGQFFDDVRELPEFVKDQKLVINAGVSSYPDNGDILGDLIKLAFEKSNNAKKEGPWKTHCADVDKDFAYMESKGKRILVIDDDEDIIKMIQYAFQMRGFEVITHQQGEPALRWLKDHIIKDPPHMIVLDCNLPDVSGMIILDKIKQMAGDSISILMLSSLSQEKNILEALRKGAQEYVTKPFSMNVLMEKTLHLLSQ